MPARSSLTVVLGTLVAVFFALNFLTFVNQLIHKRSGCTERVVRVETAHADAADTQVRILHKEMKQVERELARAQRDMERAEVEMAEIDLRKLRKGLEEAQRFMCGEEFERARQRFEETRERIKTEQRSAQRGSLDIIRLSPGTVQLQVAPLPPSVN